MNLYEEIVKRIQETGENSCGITTDGDTLFCSDETRANCIADLLDAMGYDAVTGYYNPEEDKQAGTVDSYTGLYYVSV